MSAQVQSGKPKSFEQGLEAVRNMPADAQALEELGRIEAQNPYTEMRVAAVETAGLHLQRLASRCIGWSSPLLNPERLALIEAYLKLLLSWLPLERPDTPSSYELERERRVLGSLGAAEFGVVYPQSLREEHLAPLWHILRYSQTLPRQDWKETRKVYDSAVELWTQFIRSDGLLGVVPKFLQNPRDSKGQLLEIAEPTRPLLDEICAWLALEPKNDNLLWLVRGYGARKTQEVVRRRFWEMVRGNIRTLSLSPENLGADPIGYMLVSGVGYSNRLYVAHMALAARLDWPYWRISAQEPPSWFFAPR